MCATFQPLQTCIVSSVHGCWPSERVFSGLLSTAQPRRRRTECKAEWHRKRFPNNFIHLILMCSTCLAFVISPPALCSRDTWLNPAVFYTPAASVTSCTHTVCLYRDSTSQILNTCWAWFFHQLDRTASSSQMCMEKDEAPWIRGEITKSSSVRVNYDLDKWEHPQIQLAEISRRSVRRWPTWLTERMWIRFTHLANMNLSSRSSYAVLQKIFLHEIAPNKVCG